MIVETFAVGPLQCNCSIIACEETKEAIIVDPGGEAPKILDRIKELNLKVKYLLHTHAHFDHIGATREVKEATNAKILLHPKDLFLYDNINQQGSMFGFNFQETLPVEKDLEHEMVVEFGKHSSLILHTPGHTPGSVCFHLEDKESHLFAGDTLFQGSIGRTDLWGGSFPDIIRSIKEHILPLESSTTIYPGHGPITTVWQEKKQNPFLK